jgi:hypothetical protein
VLAATTLPLGPGSHQITAITWAMRIQPIRGNHHSSGLATLGDKEQEQSHLEGEVTAVVIDTRDAKSLGPIIDVRHFRFFGS